MSKTIILFIFLPGYEIRAVDDPGPRPHGSGNRWTLRVFPAGCCMAGCKSQRGCPASPILRFHPCRNKLRQGGFLFLAACSAAPFRRYGCRARKPYASSLAAGERRPRKCRDDSWNDFRDDSCDDGPRGDAGARRIGQDRRRGITSLLRPVRRRCFRRHRPVRRCSCRRCGSTWQCVSPRRSVCRSGS